MTTKNTDEVQPQTSPTPKRVPVASADGNTTAQLNDQQSGKRKRVRISTMDKPINKGLSRFPQQIAPAERTNYRNPRDLAPNSASQRPSAEETQHERAEHIRREYHERYQAERAGGNYGYDYNKKSNQHGASGTSNGQAPKAKQSKKKVKLPKIQPAPEQEIKYPENIAPDAEIRLNKYIANAGICSRRDADSLITRGEISVNGVVVTELGKRVKITDLVEYKGKRVEGQSKVYVLLNKPKNCVTTSDDPECRLTVMDLVKNACSERIYPVGRLDRQTTGVLLVTNDGDLAAKLTHPSYLKKKIYQVWLDKPVAVEDMQAIADGFQLEDGEIHADAISYVTEDDLSQVGIEIHSGRNRIVRRIFEHFGYHVRKLDRVYFAGLTKKNLPRGKWRYLDEQEVNNLRMGAFD